MKQILKRCLVIVLAMLILSVFVVYISTNVRGIIVDEAITQSPTVLQSYITPDSTASAAVNRAVTAETTQDMPTIAVTHSYMPTPTATQNTIDEKKATATPRVLTENSFWKAINREENYNGELQLYSQDNVEITDGKIVIRSKKENRGLKGYTSGMVESKESFLYGSFSFKIRVSKGKGLFPAIWLLPKKDKQLPEIDIFEMIGSNPLDFYGVLHYMNKQQKMREYFHYEVKKKDTYVVGLTWTKSELCWYIDGKCLFRTSKGVPQEPMYLIINQAIGGIWAESPDKTTKFPATFIVESYEVKSEARASR